MISINQLRLQGYRVDIVHGRDYKIPSLNAEIYNLSVDILNKTKKTLETKGLYTPIILKPRGGQTIVRLYNEANELLATGVADCSSKDAFCKKIGREIALGRALENLKMANVSTILQEVEVDKLKKFVSHEMNARTFESLCTAARKLVRQYGAEEVRTKVRNALRRRDIVV